MLIFFAQNAITTWTSEACHLMYGLGCELCELWESQLCCTEAGVGHHYLYPLETPVLSPPSSVSLAVQFA